MRVMRHQYARKRTSRRYYTEWRDEGGRIHRIPGFVDKQATIKLADKLETLRQYARIRQTPPIELIRWVDELDEKTRARVIRHRLISAELLTSRDNLIDLVSDWKDELVRLGRDEKNAESRAEHVRRVLDLAGVLFAHQLTPGAVRDALARLTYTVGKDKPRTVAASVKTRNHFLQDVRQFAGWLADRGVFTANPLDAMKPERVRKADRTRIRRAATVEELRRLLGTTRTGPDRYGMPGADRALLYELAIVTGLRRNELVQLTAGDFELTKGRRFIELRAQTTKNREGGRQYLSSALAERMRAHLRSKHPDAPAVRCCSKSNISRMLKADLTAAKVQYRDAKGEYLDFHALRGCFATYLRLAGVDQSTISRAMRHSSTRMTEEGYQRVFEAEILDALDRIPDLSATASA